ncbi:MAG: TIGR00282 family metallophosphoesterase [bacterium]|nr:TIGR00282 family metallophosphoesterase [bacterium]
MKILFVGDIFGAPGRKITKELLPGLIEEHKPDLVLANPENLSHGNGFSSSNIKEMQQAGIEFFTNGNHAWGNKEGASKLDDPKFPVLRPANYPPGVPGRGYEIVKGVLVISLIGRIFMKKDFDCPFRKMDEILEETKGEDLKGIFVDFHAETTAEKYALAFYLDGRVSAVVGTHTHVQTRDERILENGTAYITDVGMTGPYDSVIGVKKEIVLETFLSQVSQKFEPETTGTMVFSAVVVTLDDKTKKALNIDHVFKLQ